MDSPTSFFIGKDQIPVPLLVPLLLLLRRLKTLLRRFKTRPDALRRVLVMLK